MPEVDIWLDWRVDIYIINRSVIPITAHQIVGRGGLVTQDSIGKAYVLYIEGYPGFFLLHISPQRIPRLVLTREKGRRAIFESTGSQSCWVQGRQIVVATDYMQRVERGPCPLSFCSSPFTLSTPSIQVTSSPPPPPEQRLARDIYTCTQIFRPSPLLSDPSML